MKRSESLEAWLAEREESIKKENPHRTIIRINSYKKPLEDVGYSALISFFTEELSHKKAIKKADEICEYIKYFHKKVKSKNKNAKVIKK